MPATRLLAVGLALLCSAAAAEAQTVVSRQISVEPVETTVTVGPYGTVVTRRPLELAQRPIVAPGYVSPGYVAPGYAAPAYAAPAYGTIQVRSLGAPALVIEEDDEDAVRTVVVRRPPPARIARPVAPVVDRPVARRGGPPVLARAVEPAPRVAARRVSVQPLALRPAEREIIYRTIVRERVYLNNGYAAPAPVGYAAYGGYVAPQYAARPVYAVGAALPQTVALAPVPSTVVVQAPVTRGYQYAVINNRVLLVDPATAIIVADVTP